MEEEGEKGGDYNGRGDWEEEEEDCLWGGFLGWLVGWARRLTDCCCCF
jgi:hypothetical protein